MTQENKKSKNIVGILIAVICVLVLVIVVMAISKKDDTTNDVPAVTESATVQATEIATPEPTEVIEFYEIKTSYINLKYPVKWQNNIRTEIEEGDVYKVHFYGTVEGREEQHLFTIGFNDPVGYELGTLITADGTKVKVTVESYNFDTTDWSEEEVYNILEMQNNVNFIIQELDKETSFEMAK